MSHVAHKDVAVMTIASFLGIIAGADHPVLLLHRAVRRRLRPARQQRPERPAALLILLMIVCVARPTRFSFLLIRLLSRYRELAADRSGALLTGQPSR